MKVQQFISYAVLIMLLTNCQSPSDSSFHVPLQLPPPRVTGIWIVKYEFFIYGSWGNPNENVESREVELSVPSPNPSWPSFEIYFRLLRGMRISIWIQKAYGPGEDGSPFDQGVLSSQPYKGFPVVKVLFDNEFRDAGTYSGWVKMRDENGQPLPPGFYRLYLYAEGELLWRNLLLAQGERDLPPGFPGIP